MVKIKGLQIRCGPHWISVDTQLLLPGLRLSPPVSSRGWSRTSPQSPQEKPAEAEPAKGPRDGKDVASLAKYRPSTSSLGKMAAVFPTSHARKMRRSVVHRISDHGGSSDAEGRLRFEEERLELEGLKRYSAHPLLLSSCTILSSSCTPLSRDAEPLLWCVLAGTWRPVWVGRSCMPEASSSPPDIQGYEEVGNFLPLRSALDHSPSRPLLVPLTVHNVRYRQASSAP